MEIERLNLCIAEESGENLINLEEQKYEEFRGVVGDLLERPEVQRIDILPHHYRTSRLQHSINVSYFSFVLSKKLNLDCISTARGGLLHDLFYYDFYKEKLGAFKHSARHPVEAAANAKEICELNEIEEDIILKHMWLMTWGVPKYKESFVVSFVDKFSAVYEIMEGAYLYSAEKMFGRGDARKKKHANRKRVVQVETGWQQEDE